MRRVLVISGAGIVRAPGTRSFREVVRAGSLNPASIFPSLSSPGQLRPQENGLPAAQDRSRRGQGVA